MGLLLGSQPSLIKHLTVSHSEFFWAYPFLSDIDYHHYCFINRGLNSAQRKIHIVVLFPLELHFDYIESNHLFHYFLQNLRWPYLGTFQFGHTLVFQKQYVNLN